MFTLTISDHILIAHSIRGAVFAPAQKLHGCTMVVEVEFRAATLDHLNLLIDIDLAKLEVRNVLNGFDYQNLDEHPDLIGQNSTLEFMSQHIHGLLAAACRAGKCGEQGRILSGIKVQVRESPMAWASFEGPVA